MLWLSAESTVDRRAKGRVQTDYEDLFERRSHWPRGGWPVGEKSLNVFVISQNFALKASAAQLHRLASNLDAHKISLAMAGLMLTVGSEGCGGRGLVEGYSSPDSVGKAADRIREAGTKLAYIVMDEPLFFGHVYAGPGACRDTVDEVARQVAGAVVAARKVFPDVEVGDTEPVNGARVGWTSQWEPWARAYRKAVGASLAFLIVDIGWESDWQPQFADARDVLERLKIPLGVIFNGDDRDASDLAWTAHAEQRIREFDRLNMSPRIVLIDSWTLYPIHLLPEERAGTLTHVLRYYLTGHRVVGVTP